MPHEDTPHRPDTVGRRTAVACFTAVVSTLVIACGPDRADEGDTRGDESTQEVSAVQVIGSSESIAEVRDLEVLPDGSVWILNSSPPLFVGFGPDGTPLEPHGQIGGGPEEFSFPSAFLTGARDGQAWVLDLRRHSFISASTPGSERQSIPLPRDAVPPGSVVGGHSLLTNAVRTEQWGDELLIPRTGAAFQDGVLVFRLAALQADLVGLDPTSGTTRDVLALASAIEDPSTGFERTEGGFPLWYRLWSVCEGTTIRVHDRIRNTVRGFDRDGNEVDAWPLPPKRVVDVTPRQFARAIFSLRAAEVAGRVGGTLSPEDSLRVVNEILQRVEGRSAQLANYLPEYVDLRCDEEGGVWLHPLDLEKAGTQGGRLWLRVDGSGSAQEIELPDRFDVYRFRDGRIWGVQRDEFDVATVAWVANPALP